MAPLCEYEFERKFSDSEYSMARYRRTLTAFGDFLVHEGLVALLAGTDVQPP